MLITIGIDPGISGALALLHGDLVFVYDMPTITVKKAKKQQKCISPIETLDVLRGWFEEYGALPCAIEEVGAMPGNGSTGMFRFGDSYGVVRAMAIAAGHRVQYVRPAVWKKHLALGQDKGKSRLVAQEMWPTQSDLFKRVKDDGRAEASLLALWAVKFGRMGERSEEVGF